MPCAPWFYNVKTQRFRLWRLVLMLIVVQLTLTLATISTLATYVLALLGLCYLGYCLVVERTVPALSPSVKVEWVAGNILTADKPNEPTRPAQFDKVYSTLTFVERGKWASVEFGWCSVWLEGSSGVVEYARFRSSSLLIGDAIDHDDARKLRQQFAEYCRLKNEGVRGPSKAEQKALFRQRDVATGRLHVDASGFAYMALSALIPLAWWGLLFDVGGVDLLWIGFSGWLVLGVIPLVMTLMSVGNSQGEIGVRPR